jgi:hypothetical protein
MTLFIASTFDQTRGTFSGLWRYATLLIYFFKVLDVHDTDKSGDVFLLVVSGEMSWVFEIKVSRKIDAVSPGQDSNQCPIQMRLTVRQRKLLAQ